MSLRSKTHLHTASAHTTSTFLRPITLQRCTSTGECKECEKKRLLSRRVDKHGTPSVAIPTIIHAVLASPGQPLGSETRAFMESHFGHDFSQVRVHIDDQAAESAQAVNALAYTVGQDVVFGAGQYSPATKRQPLLAHELTHVVQQGDVPRDDTKLSIGPEDGSLEQEAEAEAAAVRGEVNSAFRSKREPSLNVIQRDLATPPPATPAGAQPDLTKAQVQEAINFNKARYDTANTLLIQRLLGGPKTGIWTEENIEAITATQEEFGLHKDGKVGEATFRFLNREQKLEGMPTKSEDCLVSFRLVGPDAQNFGRDDATHCHFGSHFRIEAQFSPRCNCDHFEYRQFIRGPLHRTRAGVVTDLPITEPGGVLPSAFIEDTDVTDPVPHYGHRADAADALVEDHYVDSAGADAQAHGCRYRSEDFPGGPFDDCLAGDHYDLLAAFRGEIQRNGVPVQQKFWTAIHLVNWQP